MKPRCKNCGHQPYMHLKSGCRAQHGKSGECVAECGCKNYESGDIGMTDEKPKTEMVVFTTVEDQNEFIDGIRTSERAAVLALLDAKIAEVDKMQSLKIFGKIGVIGALPLLRELRAEVEKL